MLAHKGRALSFAPTFLADHWLHLDVVSDDLMLAHVRIERVLGRLRHVAVLHRTAEHSSGLDFRWASLRFARSGLISEQATARSGHSDHRAFRHDRKSDARSDAEAALRFRECANRQHND